jgi:hypothetical protein
MTINLIQKHSSAMARALIERINALSDLKHKPSKGELRELLISNLLTSFLTSQFSIGSGIVINSEGQQSNQTDIIIYDNRILPPFIKEQNIGVYPIESVIAVIEVKSWLRTDELKSSDKSANKLRKLAGNCPISPKLLPICALIGFFGKGPKNLSNELGKTWLSKHINALFEICLVGQFSWANIKGNGWRKGNCDQETGEEIKRFIALLIDNTRTISTERFNFLTSGHRDWLSAYIRTKEV